MTPAAGGCRARELVTRSARADREGVAMDEVMVDAELLRAEVRQKYKEVAVDPHGAFHFHTGRPLAKRLAHRPD
mgnify:CR=1 FL=1